MSAYEEMHSEEFVELYSVIHACILEGTLSNKMYYELSLIKEAAAKRNIKIIKLHK